MSHDFSYFRHWVDGQSETGEGFLYFQNAVTSEQRKKIEKNCPKPFRKNFEWGSCFVSFASDEFGYIESIMQAYAKDPDSLDVDIETRKNFQNDLDRWVKEVHTIAPLVFVVGPENEHTTDPWESESLKNLPTILKNLEEAKKTTLAKELKTDRKVREVFKRMREAL